MLQVPEIALGDVTFNPMARRVYSEGDVIELTEQESYLLEALALCANTMVTRRMLCSVLQLRYLRVCTHNNISVAILRLRDRLSEVPSLAIRTINSDGYKLVVS
jgi:DNA-binding response OmpR family regulator